MKRFDVESRVLCLPGGQPYASPVFVENPTGKWVEWTPELEEDLQLARYIKQLYAKPGASAEYLEHLKAWGREMEENNNGR